MVRIDSVVPILPVPFMELEAIPLGICGIMPGVPIADLLDRVYKARKQRQDQKAYELFGALLPYINFTLQNLELFLQVEKRLMVQRGLFRGPHVRGLSFEPSAAVREHIELLNDQMLRILHEEGLSLN